MAAAIKLMSKTAAMAIPAAAPGLSPLPPVVFLATSAELVLEVLLWAAPVVLPAVLPLKFVVPGALLDVVVAKLLVEVLNIDDEAE